MTDVFTVDKRRDIMSKIRGRNTMLEKLGFDILREYGLHYRKHPKGVFGNPDAANKRYKVAIFFDSDFWHGFNYPDNFHKNLPNAYWHKKIRTNIKRDNLVNSTLRAGSWIVIRLWEHDVLRNRDRCFFIIRDALMC